MKKSILYMLFSCTLLSATSCKHNSNNNVTPSGSASSPGTTGSSTTISSTIPGADWSLTLFSEKNENKTNHYSGYKFDFAANGTISAMRNGALVTGTWKQYPDDGVTKFVITLNTTDNNLLELNDDWLLISKSDNFISLKDDNSISNEQLQFSK